MREDVGRARLYGLSATCRKLLKHSVGELGLSARAHEKVLRVARTIADVASADSNDVTHLAEAINYRSLDANLGTYTAHNTQSAKNAPLGPL